MDIDTALWERTRAGADADSHAMPSGG